MARHPPLQGRPPWPPVLRGGGRRAEEGHGWKRGGGGGGTPPPRPPPLAFAPRSRATLPLPAGQSQMIFGTAPALPLPASCGERRYGAATRVWHHRCCQTNGWSAPWNGTTLADPSSPLIRIARWLRWSN